MREIIRSATDYPALFGMNDRNIAVLENELNVSVALRDEEMSISGDEDNVRLASQTVVKLMELLNRGEAVDDARVRYAVALARSGDLDKLDKIAQDVVALTHRGRPVKCKTLGQLNYVEAVRRHELTIAVGPAGTGKTYLAMALAVSALKNREVERIVLTRPAVEAGEKLGFLPGDMTQKVDPYLRPLYDAMYEMMGVDSYQRLLERGTVEVAPLAFMRGRTLSNAFIILDEAQNTTPEQMKMFLTRLGAGSRCVVTGDTTQIDLPRGRVSGLLQALEVLKDESMVGICYLQQADVVRHELVRRIVAAYEQYDKTREGEEHP